MIIFLISKHSNKCNLSTLLFLFYPLHCTLFIGSDISALFCSTFFCSSINKWNLGINLFFKLCSFWGWKRNFFFFIYLFQCRSESKMFQLTHLTWIQTRLPMNCISHVNCSRQFSRMIREYNYRVCFWLDKH